MALKSLSFLLGGMAGVLAPDTAIAQDQTYCFHADILGAPANFAITAATRQAAQMATGAALAEIARLDRLLSDYRPDSELRRLNAASEMRVSPELFAVLHMAETLRARTGGAFDARIGAVEALWREAEDAVPDAAQLRQAVEGASQRPRLLPATYSVTRPDGVQFSIDALAKGYIIDRALDAARLAGPTGILIDIGGDMRCYGNRGSQTDWPVGLPDPRCQFLNAPLVANVRLQNQAIATSGRGMRDRRIGNALYGTTLSPRTGQPVATNLSATVVAPTAAMADGMATAMMAMRPDHGLWLAAQTSGVEARITRADGAVLTTPGWATLENGQAAACLPKSPSALQLAKADYSPVGPTGWVIDWALQVYYQAPPIDIAGRSEDYRSPYMAMWISDKQGKPLRTLALIGGDPEYQKDNHVWWSLYRDRAEHLTQLRSRPTALAGRYPTFWPGYDDNYKFLPPGEYLLNIETSRERGQHTFRAVPVTVGREAFDFVVPPTADMGQIRIAFGKQP